MMKMKNIIYYAVAAIVLLVGCKKYDEPTVLPDDPLGRVRIDIDTRSMESSSVTTKATDTDLTGNIVVLVFDKTDVATAVLKQAPVEGTIKNGKINALLYKEETPSFIYVMANISKSNKDYLLAMNAGDKLSDISRDITELVNENGLKLPLVASGWSGSVAQIVKTAPTVVTITMIRAAARIDVNGVPSGFKIIDVRLVNAAQAGYVMPQRILPNFGENDVVVYNKTELTVHGTSMSGQIYCYENRGSQGTSAHPTRVVIHGTRTGATRSSYYAIDILYKEQGNSNTLWHIERNKQYTINLNKVDADGYSTYEQAVKSESFNSLIDTDIVVSDPYAYDVTTNGQQYIAVTNSEFALYPAKANEVVSDLLAVTISYTCASSWSVGSITPPEGITLLDGIEVLEVQGGADPIYRDIVIKTIEPNFKEGDITIEIGNLIKKIKVKVFPPTVRTGQVIAASSDPTYYKTGEILNPSSETSWLKLARTEYVSGPSSLNDKVHVPNGGIFAHVAPFISRGGSTDRREASFYVGGDTKEKRIRVHVQQDTYDIINENKQITPYSFVGTFHRWNQMGERIIRMEADANVTWWRVTVADGADFIVLDLAKSPDTGIGASSLSGNTPIYTTDEEIETNCQLTSRATSLIGATRNIYFRVGITSQLASANALPRYGMITVAYGRSSTDIDGVHNIYVRQGEAPDFIMRPSDSSTSADFSSLVRHEAIRFGVYNLTDDIVNQTTDMVLDRGIHGYNFVRYPSQGGFYFLASGTQAVSPTATGILAALKVPPVFGLATGWDKAWETCPKGYYRPADGDARAYSTITVANEVKKSQVRQSLWAAPSGGAEKEGHKNSVIGYLADGYFDRRDIVTSPEATNANMNNCVVNPGTVDAAYGGTLVFNPQTLASIFLPMSGSYAPLSGLKDRGNRGSFHLKTPADVAQTLTQGWLTSYGNFNGTFNPMNMYFRGDPLEAYSIRCVKDENHHFDTDDNQVEIPGNGGTANMFTVLYDVEHASLESLINTLYTKDKISNAVSIYVRARKQMSDADYLFLNKWSNDPTQKMCHIMLRGVGTETIPLNAFTSSRWISIILTDARVLEDGAFASTLTWLNELTFNYFDTMTLTKDAFKFVTNPNSNQIALYLAGVEYANHGRGQSPDWRGAYFKSVNEVK